MIGGVNLSNVVRGAWQNATLGYWLAASATGRGHATRAVRLAIAYAFAHCELHRVQAAVIPRNAASLAVVRRAGLRHEGMALRYLRIAGCWEDHEIFAATVEDAADSAPTISWSDGLSRDPHAAPAPHLAAARPRARDAPGAGDLVMPLFVEEGIDAAGADRGDARHRAPAASPRWRARPARSRRSASPPCCCSGSRRTRTRRARAPGTRTASSSRRRARSRPPIPSCS